MANVRISVFATKAVACALVLTAVLMIVNVGQELINGVTMPTNKWGPRVVYTHTTEPFKYWASVISHIFIAVVLGGMSFGTFWLARLESQADEPQKRRKR